MGRSLNYAEPEEYLAKPPHYIVVNGNEIKNFNLTEGKTHLEVISNRFGKGRRLILRGIADESEKVKIEKKLIIELYDKFPDVALIYAEYKNLESNKIIEIEKAYNNSYRLDAALVKRPAVPFDFWSFHGVGENWVEKITEDYSRDNYTGTIRIVDSNSAYTSGQGIPMIDLWNEKMGMAVAMIEPNPQIVRFPVKVEFDKTVSIGITEEPGIRIKPNETYRTYKYAVIVHNLDYFNPLKSLKKILNVQGYSNIKTPKEAYAPCWSTRGFGENFTLSDIYNKFSELKELGIKWIIIDIGWFNRIGDFSPDRNIFPSGEKSIKEIVYLIHKNGFKAMLLFLPLSAEAVSRIGKEDWFILDKNGDREMSGWGSYYLCPAHTGVREYTVKLVQKFINDWGFDGFYFDGAYLNSVPFCYAPNHNHSSPSESLESLSDFFKIIYRASIDIKPEFVIKVNPDVVCPSIYNMLQYNMPVIGSQTREFQLRSKIKALKAIFEGKAAVDCNYYESGTKDFASYVGTGGVVSLKYTALRSDYSKVIYKTWLKIYNEKRLCEGEYLNFYDIVHDKPETHLIKKDGNYYYSFFLTNWKGDIELRGLEKRKYLVKDYIHNIEIGTVKGPTDKIRIGFKNFLFLEASPR